MAERKIVQATTPFVVSTRGVPMVIGTGDLYFADDPIVVGRESLFAEVAVRSSENLGAAVRPVPTAATETAVSEPGGRRRMTRNRIMPEPSQDKPETPEAPKDPEASEV